VRSRVLRWSRDRFNHGQLVLPILSLAAENFRQAESRVIPLLKAGVSRAEYDPGMTYTVGIDLISVDDVRESIHTFGERYLARVYTAAERRDCGTDPWRLAARFAAKEASMKALSSDSGLPWRSIAVGADASGQPSLVLTGDAETLARRRGVTHTSLSLTRQRCQAGAVVVVECA
jgi:holo-[acyl-carrier protein] synthase